MSKVTVIMPVYNGERFLKQAMDSVLNQTYKDFILLLIDDASTDNSVKIIEEYSDDRICLIRNDHNLGISKTRNRGLALCNTEYIALMDDDDIAAENRLELEVKYLDDNPDIDVVGGHLRIINEKGEDINKQWSVFLNPDYIKAYLLLGNTVANGTAMLRKKLVDQYSIRFQDNFYGAEDYRFWVECSIYGRIKNLDHVFLYWRSGHNHETGRVNANRQKEREEAIDRIHIYALEKTGFQLDAEEINILNKAFKEEGIVESMEEIEKLYQALKTIAKQAQELKLEHADEIVTMCRKRFGEKVGKAFFLWE